MNNIRFIDSVAPAAGRAAIPTAPGLAYSKPLGELRDVSPGASLWTDAVALCRIPGLVAPATKPPTNPHSRLHKDEFM